MPRVTEPEKEVIRKKGEYYVKHPEEVISQRQIRKDLIDHEGIKADRATISKCLQVGVMRAFNARSNARSNPPKYQDVLEAQVARAKTQAKQNTNTLIANFCANNPNLQSISHLKEHAIEKSFAAQPSNETSKSPLEISQKELKERVFEYIIHRSSEHGVPLMEIAKGCHIAHSQLIGILQCLREDGSICEIRQGSFVIA